MPADFILDLRRGIAHENAAVGVAGAHFGLWTL